MKDYWPFRKVFTSDQLSSYVPLLIYHNITAEGLPIARSNYTLVESQFEYQMRFLSEHGYSCLTLEDFFAAPESAVSKWEKSFILTFDDGYEDFYTRAYPILKRYGFSASIFLITDSIGRTNDNSDKMPMLTKNQIKALSAEGISFGSHTCSHPRLLRLNTEQIRHELMASKVVLKDEIGLEASFLAYPYGESNPEIREIAMQAGYKVAFGVKTGEPGRFNFWRTEINTGDSKERFSLKLTRWYNYYIKLRGWVRENTVTGQYLRKAKTSHRILRGQES